MAGTHPDQGRGEETRARLVEAALVAFSQRGFHGTTTRDIAAAAGLSPAAVYVHYKSKQELLAEISIAGHQQVAQLIEDALAESSSPGEQLEAVTRAFAIHHARNNTSARVVNYELAALDTSSAATVAALRHTIDAEMRALVERGIAAGSFKCPDARLAATALLSLGIDVSRWYREDHRRSPEALGDAYAQMARRIVGAH